MSPPRKPRGEKPATTIRFLRRQIANMQPELASLREGVALMRETLKECEERERVLTDELENSADAHGELLASTVSQRTRLAFLEGYYAKSIETLPAGRPGNSEAYRDSATSGETGRQENFAERLASQSRGEIRRLRPDDSAHNYRRPMGEDTIAGPARDATTSEMARHRG